jgi:hypothetical protein
VEAWRWWRMRSNTASPRSLVTIASPSSRNDRAVADDWQAFFDERAGITEFDGGLSRAEAEAQALACCNKPRA